MAKLYASKANFGVSFKFTTARPLDDRLVVDTVNDLYNLATWDYNPKTGVCALYKGLTVSTSGGALYTYIGEAGDTAEFKAAVAGGSIPKNLWKVQGGEVQGQIGDLTGRVRTLETNVSKNTEDIKTVKATADKAVVANTAITAATDFSVVKYDAKGLVTEGKVLTAAEVPGLSALETKVNNIGVAAKETANAGYLKSYTFTGPDGTPVDIDIPKDLVVTKGEIVKEGKDTFIQLTIANQDAPVKINVKDLVDVYTAQANAAQVQLAISGTNEISATIKPGSIAKADLATAVQESLNKADAAAPKSELDAAKEEIEAIKTDVAAHGVKSVTASGTGYVTASAVTDDAGVATITVASTDALATAVTAATSALQAGDVTAGTGMLTLNVKGTTVTVPHGSMAEAAADDYLTKEATNEAINAKAEEINGTINTTKADLEGKITALENAKLTAGAGISIENNNIAVDKLTVTNAPTLSVDSKLTGQDKYAVYNNPLVGEADKYVDSATLASAVNNTNEQVVKGLNELHDGVYEIATNLNSKIDIVKVNGVSCTKALGTEGAEKDLQIATVTLDATKIEYTTGVTVAAQLKTLTDTLQWTEVSQA